jgi:ankyrin repeat protein
LGGLLILKHLGVNSIDDFYRYGHSKEAKKILENYLIGELILEEVEEEDEKEKLDFRDVLKENRIIKEEIDMRDLLKESRVEKVEFRDLLKESRVEEPNTSPKMDLWKFLENSRAREQITFEDIKKNKLEFSKFRKYLKLTDNEVYVNFLLELSTIKTLKGTVKQKGFEKLFDDYISPVKSQKPLKLTDNTFSWLIIKYKSNDLNLFDLPEQEVSKKVVKLYLKFKNPKNEVPQVPNEIPQEPVNLDELDSKAVPTVVMEEKNSRKKVQQKFILDNPFLQAVYNGNYQIVKDYIVEKNVDPNERDEKSLRTGLHIASNIGNLEICLFLLGKGASINIKDSMGYSPFALSVKNHYWEIADNLSLFGADFESKNSNGMTVLHESLQYGDLASMNWILNKKKNKLNPRDNLGQTPFLRSLEQSPLQMILKFMSIPGVDPTIEDNNGRNLFHFAARNQRDDILHHILENNEVHQYEKMLNSCEKLTGQHPLHYAVRYGNYRTVNLLIKMYRLIGCSIHAKDNFGDSPLSLCDSVAERVFQDYITSNNYYSVEKIQWKVKKFLHMKNSLLNVKESLKSLKKETTNLEPKVEVIDILRESRVDKVDFRDLLKESRVETEKVDLRGFLGDSKVKREEITFDSIKKNKTEFTKFRKYLKSEEMDHYLKFLLDLSCVRKPNGEISESSIEVIFNQYFSPIKSPDPLKLSTNTNASVLLKFKEKESNLFDLPEKEIQQWIVKLYKRFNNPKIKNKKFSMLTIPIEKKIEFIPSSFQTTPVERKSEETILSISDITQMDDKLIKAVVTGNFEIVKELFENSETVSLFNETLFSQLRYSQTLLHFAVLGSHLKIVEYLIEKGCPPDSFDKMHRSPLHLAASMGSEEITILLLGYGAKINLKDSFGYTPLSLAVKNHYWSICEHLLLFGADLNYKKDDGMNILHECLKDNDSEALDWILNKEKIKLNSKDQIGSTPLFYAVEFSSLDLITKFLSTKGVDMCATDNISRNIFHLMAKCRRIDVLDHILENFDTKIYESLLESKEKLTEQVSLHYAVKFGNFQTLKSLFEIYKKCCVNTNIKDVSGDTPLSICDKMIEKSFSDFISSNQVIYPHMLNNRLQEYRMMKEYIMANSVLKELKKKPITIIQSKSETSSPLKKIKRTPRLSLLPTKRTPSPNSNSPITEDSPRTPSTNSLFNLPQLSQIFRLIKPRASVSTPPKNEKGISNFVSVSEHGIDIKEKSFKKEDPTSVREEEVITPKHKYKRASLDLSQLKFALHYNEFDMEQYEDNHRLERGDAILDSVKIVDGTEYTFGIESPRLNSDSSDESNLNTDDDAEDYDLDHPDILNILNQRTQYEMF